MSRSGATAPSPWLLVYAGIFVVMGTLAVATPADADLWGHIAFGRDIMRSGQIVLPDQYSFTSDVAWINHEWLSEVVFAEAFRLGGATGLVLLKVTMILGLMGLVWWTLGRRGVAGTPRVLLTALAFAGTYWRMHNVRPQLFSVLLFALLALILTEAEAGRRRVLLAVPLIAVVWVNAHGGWIVGVGALGVWTAARLLDSRVDTRERVWLALVGLVTLAATLINPYGLKMWDFLAGTVRLGRADVVEWGSILTSPLALGLPWLTVAAVAVMAIVRSTQRPPAGRLAIVAGLAFASFRVARLDAFFAISVVLLLSPELAAAWPSPASGNRTRGPSRIGILAVTVGAVLLMSVPAATIAAPYADCIMIAGPWAPDREASRFIAANRLQGRMLTWFDWGEYAIWHFGPSLRVSFDGRRETVYSDRVIAGHREFYAADTSAATFVSALAPDYIWMPKHAPITSKLARMGWTPVFDGPASSVFARPDAGPFAPAPPAIASSHCFPGP